MEADGDAWCGIQVACRRSRWEREHIAHACERRAISIIINQRHKRVRTPHTYGSAYVQRAVLEDYVRVSSEAQIESISLVTFCTIPHDFAAETMEMSQLATK